MRFLSLIVFLGVLLPISGQQQNSAQDLSFTARMMAGEYILVGQRPDSTATYSGRVVLKRHGTDFDVTRTINGKVVQGTAFVNTSTADHIPQLIMHFPMDGEPYEGAFLWHWAAEYIRLTGYVYLQPKQRTKFPGFEALFPIAPLTSP